jgi:hypothetical protein
MLLLVAFATSTAAGGVRLSATLTGAAEIPAADPDGSGTFSATVNPGNGMLCYQLTAADIGTTIAAHIHINFSDANGPIVIPLATPTTGASSACLSLPRHKLMALLKAPQAFYVNVHSVDFPNGAIRGQVHK